jgi:hypothetical protein
MRVEHERGSHTQEQRTYPGQAEHMDHQYRCDLIMEMVACFVVSRSGGSEVANPDSQSLQKGGELIFIFLNLIDLLGPFDLICFVLFCFFGSMPCRL